MVLKGLKCKDGRRRKIVGDHKSCLALKNLLIGKLKQQKKKTIHSFDNLINLIKIQEKEKSNMVTATLPKRARIFHFLFPSFPYIVAMALQCCCNSV